MKGIPSDFISRGGAEGWAQPILHRRRALVQKQMERVLKYIKEIPSDFISRGGGRKMGKESLNMKGILCDSILQ